MRVCAFFLQNLLKVFLKSESSGLAWRAKKLFFCLLIRSKREREREQERERKRRTTIIFIYSFEIRETTQTTTIQQE